MRVALIVNSHLNRPGNFGQRARYIVDYCRANNICVQTLARGSINDKPDTLMILFHIYCLFLAFIRHFLNRKMNTRYYERLIFEYCVIRKNKKFHFDKSQVVHLWEFSPRLIKFFKNRGCKVILEVPSVTQNYIKHLHNQSQAEFLNYHQAQEKNELTSAALADAVLVPSEFVRQWLSKGGIKHNVYVNSFGAANKMLHHNANSFSSDKVRVLFVGNVDARKGILSLLKVAQLFQEIDEKEHEVEFICIGRIGPAVRSKLKNAPKNITFHGFKDPDDYFREADIFYFPTYCEGSAKVVFEAMSFSLPIITTDAAGSPLEDKQGGFLLDPDDVISQYNALRFLIENEVHREKYGKHNKLRIANFTWPRYAENVVRKYEYLRHS